MLSTLKFEIILFGMAQLLRYAAWRYPVFRARLKERNLVAQLKARDEEIGRWFAIHDGKVTSGRGLRADAVVTLAFKNATLGADLLMPPINWLDQINAQKDFKLTVDGPEDLTNWFAQTIMMSQSVGLKIGTRLADGTMRYCNMTNGGPVFVYVKDGKIVRMTPIDFGDDDPPPWTIEARLEAHAAAQDDARPARAEREVDRLFARPPALSHEARRLRPQWRAQPAEPRQVRLCAHLMARGARPRRRRDQAAQAPTGRVSWRCRTARTTPGAISATTCRRCSASATPSATPRSTTTPTAGRAGTGARCITGATRCASASRRPTARSRTACRTAT